MTLSAEHLNWIHTNLKPVQRGVPKDWPHTAPDTHTPSIIGIIYTERRYDPSSIATGEMTHALRFPEPISSSEWHAMKIRMANTGTYDAAFDENCKRADFATPKEAAQWVWRGGAE